MALRLAAVGKLIEVQIDGDSPDILPQSSFMFDQKVDTGIRIVKSFGKSMEKVYNYNEIYISGVQVSSYADFKTKIAAIFT